MQRAHVGARWLAIIGALIHLLLPWFVVLPQDPSGPGAGPDWTLIGSMSIGAVALLGILSSVRLPSLGTALIGAAAITSLFATQWEHRAIVGLMSVPLLVATALLLLNVGTPKREVRGRRAALGAILVGGYAIRRMIDQHATEMGQRYPDSATVKPNWRADWFWVGGVSPTSATITAAGLSAGSQRLAHWTNGGERRMVDAVADAAGVARFELDGLTPGVEQSYRLVDAEGAIGDEPDASFTTPPTGAHDVTIAFASCARTGSNGAVFDTIRALEPDLFIHLGDLHYGNLTSRRPDDHLFLLTRALSTPAQSALFSSVPCAWIWDDHDYGPNDSDSSSPSRRGALDNYRRSVPAWDIDVYPEAPVNQAFSVGRVRVIIIDTRSRRTRATMLGAEQEAWLIDELVESSRTHALVVWANPAPWNMPDRPGTDQWGGYGEERRRIANAIATAGIDNLVMVSGDWHLSAIDDGTNTGFADDGSLGFPLIHGAPLDRPAARTNEPYTHGLFSNPGQFGSVHIADDGGSTVEVTLTSHLWTGTRMGEYAFTVDVPS